MMADNSGTRVRFLFRLYDAPKDISSYELYTIFRKCGRIKHISERYGEIALDRQYDTIQDISMQSPDVIKLMRLFKREAKQNHMKLRFMHDAAGSDSSSDDDSDGGDGASTASDAPNAAQPPLTGEQPPDQQSPKHILNALNDHCLWTIFESPALDLWDLVAIANVCKRFNAIAQNVFPSKFDGDCSKSFNFVDLWRVEECLRTFGHHITSIDVKEEDVCTEDVVLRLQLDYCRNIAQLNCSVTCKQTILAMRPLMQTLKDLTIHVASVDFRQLFDPSAECALQKLHLFQCSELDLPELQLAQLQHLHICGNINTPLRTEFFAFNAQLTVLRLDRVDVEGGIGAILQHLPHLHELEIGDVNVDPKVPSSFQPLQHLKELIVTSYRYDDVLFILDDLNGSQVCLEKLSLNVKIEANSGLSAAICKQKRLKELRVKSCGAGGLIGLVSELEHLESVECIETCLKYGVATALDEIDRILEQGRQLISARHMYYPSPDGGEVATGAPVSGRVLQAIDANRRARNIDVQVVFQRGTLARVSATAETIEELLRRHSEWLTMR